MAVRRAALLASKCPVPRSRSQLIGSREYQRLTGRNAPRNEGGFTLVEALIAFAVLSIVLAIVTSSTAGGLELLNRGARQQIALREAQSLLEAVGYAYPLEPGTVSGRIDKGRYQWSLTIERRDEDTQSVLRDAEGRAATLFDIKSVVTWRERLGERSITLSSSRLGYTVR